MKAATIIGILLIILGIVGFSVGGFSFAHKKNDANVGPIHISHTAHTNVPISPVFSTISLIAGVGLVVVGLRSR